MKNLLRHLADWVTLPVLRFSWADRFAGFLSYQRRRATRRKIETRLYASGEYGDEVTVGPFKGLRYPPLDQWASCRFEKIIGAYEHELHGLVTRLAATKQYDLIVNVGAAEGFYTAGLAMLFPKVKIVSFEADEKRTRFCRNLCRLNQVWERIETRGHCSPEDLAALNPTGRVLVWMDIDTGERPVLDPAKVPWLRDADILVELHDCLEAGLTPLIRGRFEGTHHIEQFNTTGLEYGRFPLLRDMLFNEIEALVGEDRRGLQDWFFMEPLNASSIA
jgi:predicted O-methyltransferase YrrM